MGCPKCGSSETRYIPEHMDEQGERAHRAHVAHEVGNAYQHPRAAVTALALAGVGWLMTALRNNWECQECHHTWHSSGGRFGDEDQERQRWWQFWRKAGEDHDLEEKRIIPMFERLTLDAQATVALAWAEAASAGSVSLDPQHLLLGMLAWYPNPSSELLRSVRASLVWVVESLLSLDGPEAAQDFRSEIEKTFPPIQPRPNLNAPPLILSHEVERILAYAAEEAQHMRKSDIGVGHIVLGILREEHRVSAILRNRGLQLPAAREKLAGYLEKCSKAARDSFG